MAVFSTKFSFVWNALHKICEWKKKIFGKELLGFCHQKTFPKQKRKFDIGKKWIMAYEYNKIYSLQRLSV